MSAKIEGVFIILEKCSPDEVKEVLAECLTYLDLQDVIDTLLENLSGEEKRALGVWFAAD